MQSKMENVKVAPVPILTAVVIDKAQCYLKRPNQFLFVSVISVSLSVSESVFAA